jgi:hypothetical protein
MTFSHALVANTSPSFSVNEDDTLNNTIAYSGAQNFVINKPPYEQGDSDKLPRFQNFSLQSNGSFTLEAEANWHGTLVFEWNATDSTSGATINGTATITVNSINDPPQIFILDKNFASVTSSLSVEENEQLIGYVNVVDVDGTVVVPALDIAIADSAKFTIDSANAADLNSDGKIDYPLKGNSGFNYEVPSSAAGSNTHQIGIEADDSQGGTVSHALNVLVTDQDEAPVLSGPASSTKTIQEDAISSTDIGSWYKIHNDSYPGYNASDPDSASTSHTWTFNPAPQMGTAQFSVNPNMQTPVNTVIVAKGTTVYLNYIPDANASGTNIDSFTVRVTDESGNYDTMQFSVTITPVDDLPVFTSSVSSTSNPHIIASGSTGVFHTVAASDADAGSSISYSTVTGYDDQYFSVNSSNGRLTSTGITNQSDEDGDGVYRFQVRATETNTGQMVDQWVYVVINQPPYFVDKNGDSITTVGPIEISEGENPTSWDEKWAAELNGLQALDPGTNGASATSVTTWTVSSQAANGSATVNGIAGLVDYTPSADFVGTDSFTITATDSSNLTGSLTFNVTVTPVNDQPEVTRADGSGSTTITMDEGGSFVIDFQGDDSLDGSDASSGTSHRWKVSGPDSNFFYIIDINGSLYFLNSPDFEQPMDQAPFNRFDIAIEVSDDGATYSTPKDYEIVVTDVNEAPVFTDTGNLITDPFDVQTGYFDRVDVPENSTFVFEPNVTDPEGNNFSYTLNVLSTFNVSTGSSLFNIDSSTGKITLSHAIDYENPNDLIGTTAELSGTSWWSNDPSINAGFHLEITATEIGTSPSLSSTQKVLVAITDVNEHAQFNQTQSFVVYENIQDVGKLSDLVTDPEGDTITYGINQDYIDGGLFTIDSATGEISFKNMAPNFETPSDAGTDNIYNLQVYVESNGEKVYQTFTVNVLDDNDAPTLDIDGSSRTIVVENRAHVITFNSEDQDNGLLLPGLVYLVDGKELRSQNHSGQSNSPYVTGTSVHSDLGSKSLVTADFNRDGLDDIVELISNNEIRVHLNEGNNQFPITPLSMTSQTLTVDEIMVADLSGDGYPDVIALDKTNGKILGWAWDSTAPAISPAFVPLASLGGSLSSEVALVSELTPSKILEADIDTDGFLDLLILSQGDKKIAWVENKGQREFSFSSTSNVILSDTSLSQEVADLEVADFDFDGDLDLVFLTDSNISMMANQGSGVFAGIETIHTFDFGSPYHLEIADINGDKKLDILVSVDRSNSGLPSYHASLLNLSTLPVSFGAPNNFSLGTLALSFEVADIDSDSDLDLLAVSNTGILELFRNEGGGNFSSVGNISSLQGNITKAEFANFETQLDDTRFSIVGGKDQSSFEFRPSYSPSLWFKTPPDYESPVALPAAGYGKNEYQVIIEAKSLDSSAGTSSSVNHTLVVEVINENDNSPVFELKENGIIEIEHEENISFITTLIATDIENDPLTWSITGGADASLFSLSSTGNLSFVGNPDYEQPRSATGDNNYIVSLQVSDGDFAVDHSITIKVQNANDNEPVLTNTEFKDGKITISLDENKTYSVIDLNSVDDDLDPVTIGILPGKDAAYFSINNNKIVEFLAIPDFDNPKDSDSDNTYEFDLQITDQKYTQIVPVFVGVKNINDLAPVWITKGGQYSIPENRGLAIDLNASDDFQDSIVFTLDPTSPDYQFFDLNQSSGQLAFKTGFIPDYEKPSDLSPDSFGNPDRVYEVIIQLKDTDYTVASEKFFFRVEDLDEFPTYTNLNLTLNEDTALTFGPIDFNMTDPEGEVFQLSISAGATNGELIDLGNQHFSYRPDSDFFGGDSFKLLVTEGNVSSEIQIQVTTLDVNDPPQVQNDQYDYTFTAREAMPLPVLKNDSSFPDDNASEILAIIDWRIDMNSSRGDLADYDWAGALPPLSAGPFLLGSEQFLFTPPAGFIGPVSIIYTVSDGGLTTEGSVQINVTQSPELPGWKYFAEFGYFYLEANGWALHEKMGWIYLADPDALLNATAWCWSESLGWFWTGRSYFDYIYVNEFSKWMQWQGGVNEPDGWSLMTDYATKEVVSSEVFQIQRAAATISAFSNSTEVINYVQDSDLFSTQDKQEIVRELIFTKSSETLVSYGIQLSF